MKNLSKASDKEIYKMRESIKFMLNLKQAPSCAKKMEKELDKEYEKRGIIPPLSWEFECLRRKSKNLMV